MGSANKQAWYIIDFGGDKIARLDTACKRWQTSIADELLNFYAASRANASLPPARPSRFLPSVQAGSWEQTGPKAYALFPAAGFERADHTQTSTLLTAVARPPATLMAG